MKLGYPCINRSIGCTANRTFRLASYSDELLIEKVENNINCLEKILEYNLDNNYLFFRISSEIVPFASHPVCTYDWGNHFKKDFERLGKFIKKNKMRISMHPDQFILINALKEDIVNRSILELDYHAKVLDLMKLDKTSKIQIHVGGVYGDKEKSMERFVKTYDRLDKKIKDRLAIENDHKLYSLKDCSDIHKKTKIPIIFDSFHHECLNNEETFLDSMKLVKRTWKKTDGIPMIDYSSQAKDGIVGKHTEHIDIKLFKKFIEDTKTIDYDIMLEIKDKEKSAKEAIEVLRGYSLLT